MRTLVTFFAAALCCSVLGAQSQQLVQEHSLLTKDCKRVRGHAQGIFKEASQSTLNKDVALAHASEVSKSLKEMEARLKRSKELLTPDQTDRVSKECGALEGLCMELQETVSEIEKELAKEKPDRIKVRNLSKDVRDKMRHGSDQHDLLKRKLGIK